MRLHEAVALAILGHERESDVDALGDRLRGRACGPWSSTEPCCSGHAAGEYLEEFGAAGAHEPVQAHDLAVADLEIEAVDGKACRIGRVGDRDLRRATARDLAESRRAGRGRGRRRAPDHVRDDPVDVDLVALARGDERSVAEDDGVVGDLERLLEVVGDVDDRDAGGGELADEPEEHLDLGAAEGRGGLVHDEHARFAGERPGDLDDLLLSEAQVADERLRVEVLREPSHQLTVRRRSARRRR